LPFSLFDFINFQELCSEKRKVVHLILKIGGKFFCLWILQKVFNRAKCTALEKKELKKKISFLSALLIHMPKFDEILAKLWKFHLSLFFIFNDFAEVSQRLCTFSYLSEFSSKLSRGDSSTFSNEVQKDTKNGWKTSYSFLGLLMMIPLISDLVKLIRKASIEY